MDIIAIVPAKETSIRLPNKNLLELGGKPLFMHSVEFGISEGFRTIVSTDSPIIKFICKDVCEVVSEFPQESRMENVIFNWLRTTGEKPDYIITLQPTSPIRTKGLIKRCFGALGDKESLVTVNKVRPLLFKDNKPLFNPYNRLITQETKNEDFYFYFNGNIVITKTSLLIDKNVLFDENVVQYETTRYESCQIDYGEDMAMVKWIYGNGQVL